MALTLTSNLAIPTDLEPAIDVAVTGTVPAAIGIGYRFRLDDEALELRGFRPTVPPPDILGGAATQETPDRNAWIVERAIAGTTAATHTAGASVLGVTDALTVGDDEDAPGPFAGGGEPDAHAASHTDGGGDEVTIAGTQVTFTPGESGLSATDVQALGEELAARGLADVVGVDAELGDGPIVSVASSPVNIRNQAETAHIGTNVERVQLAAQLGQIDILTEDGHIDVLANAGLQLLADSDDIALVAETGGITFSAAGGTIHDVNDVLTISGFDLTLNAGNLIANLPSGDPMVAGALYVDGSGFVKQSAG